MRNLNDNIVVVKSMDFAIRCVKLAKLLRESYHEFDLASQILRSGTSIGANVREALRGQSRADFRAKMNISLREANEPNTGLNCSDMSITSPEGNMRVSTTTVQHCVNYSCLL